MTTLWANRVQEAKCERFCTFTNIGQTREEIRYTFQHIIRDFRRAGKVFEYWGVVELHKSGKPHMHCIQSGSYMPRYLWKGVIEKNGWGHNDIRRCWDGLDAARYCAKHLCHSHGRRWTGRLIRYSKGFFPETAKEHKEQFRELGVDWQMCFGRADRVANFLETRGLQVEPGVLGVDWIQPEKMVKNEIRLSVPRVGRLGYVIHDKSWDEVLRRSTDGFSGDESASVWPSVPSRDEAAAAAVDSLCE